MPFVGTRDVRAAKTPGSYLRATGRGPGGAGRGYVPRERPHSAHRRRRVPDLPRPPPGCASHAEALPATNGQRPRHPSIWPWGPVDTFRMCASRRCTWTQLFSGDPAIRRQWRCALVFPCDAGMCASFSGVIRAFPNRVYQTCENRRKVSVSGVSLGGLLTQSLAVVGVVESRAVDVISVARGFLGPIGASQGRRG